MAHAGPNLDRTDAAYHLQAVSNHQKLMSTIFPPSANEKMTDDPAAVASKDLGGEMFHCAASQGMLSSVVALLAGGSISCEFPDRSGRTPLHWAAEQGHLDVVLALLRAGACVNPRSQRKTTPIMLAASRGHVVVVGMLIHYGAGESDCWPLNGHRHGIEHWRSTALHCAAAGGHVEVVKHLLGAGFDKGQRDGAGLIPAELSAGQSHSSSLAITHLLLPSDMGGKLVYAYVSRRMEDVAMVSGLAKGGAFLDWQNGNGETPLHRAVHFRHVAISRVLLKAGADPNLRDRRGTSPLHVAACTGCGEIVLDLLRAGTDVESQRVGGQSPLHMAVVNIRADVVSILLSVWAFTEHRDNTQGQTPLSSACERCLPSIVRLLTKAGADVESRCLAGLTPLHWACRFNDAESVEVLLSAGADPGAVDRAAVQEAVETSSSRSGTTVSVPVAVDVVGLGYPLACMKHSRSPSVTSAARRSDLGSVGRIKSALRGAKQQRSWRRRGWLVILANRCDAIKSPCARGKGCTSFCGGSTRLLGEGVSAITDSSCSGSCRVQELWTSEHDHVSKRLRSADNAMWIAREASRQQQHRRGEIGARAKKVEAVIVSELVRALFELAGVEVGIFRRVVLFI